MEAEVPAPSSPAPISPGTPLGRPALAKECLIASLGILLALGVIKHLGQLLPLIGQNALTIAAILQLYIPLSLIDRRGISRESLGFDTKNFSSDLGLALVLGLCTIVPFAIAHHLYQTMLFGRLFRLHAPSELLLTALSQVIAVALPEEMFFRGYLQGRLELLWPARRRLFGVPFGKAVLVAASVFALAHVVGEYRIDRLGPFFPALLFGLLRTRTQSLVAPVAYHAFCNILSDVLFSCYH